jgi:hypothetical protein
MILAPVGPRRRRDLIRPPRLFSVCGRSTISLRNTSVESIGVNYWNWRPTLKLIASFNLIDDERLELMGCQLGVDVSEKEAGEIATRIERDVLANLPSNGRLLLDLSVATEPDDYKVHQGNEFLLRKVQIG